MGTINTGDTAFIIISAALVFLMTPGLALFYGGMVKRKNVLSTIMSSFFICGLASVLWVAIGYSLSFGKDTGGVIGSLNWAFFNGVTGEPNATYAATIPHTLFAAFQMMFAIITPALITGALVERMKFSRLFVFIALWSIVVYYPMAHMMWGDGGLLRNLGAIDFAGGNVVHISSGVSAVVAAIILGKRKGYGVASGQPHNIPLIFIGAALLWFGWFGFNAGSALGSGELAVHALLTTNTSAATALLSWMLVEKITRGKPTMLGAATGAVVGLVAITPGAGFVPIWASLIIGAAVSPICYFAMSVIKPKFGYDDSLDAFGCHGIGGIWGGIATGIFAKNSINPVAQWDGLIYGETRLFVAQLISIAVTIALSIVGTALIMFAIKLVSKEIRVTAREESEGLDISQHGESAYPSFTGMD
ncbi:Amt family ammonium transporter [Ruminiclostridium sufflavum DSM 19573]|uniref:Ammonium transporter n=1 Tax=Ruminiclostridium sufflavum DSM 19573 TaxID=1121337 RepID=A0A318Y3Q8_9FIRM|nr:ammonium transporter [Ruminiclostridium sufflavum]PYG86661.1 Amt family ammonium transporter [Ruminiclostridium sufflavum DSM 19573]